MVVFRTDLGPPEACHSPRVGLVKTPIFHPNTPRSGDHTTESCLWVMGRRVGTGERLADANVLAIAPTLLRLLDMLPPERLDGRPIPLFETSEGRRKSIHLPGFVQ